MNDWNPKVSACDGKQAHATPLLATKVAKKMRQKSVKPYRCKWCGKWHVGGKAGRKKYSHKRH